MGFCFRVVFVVGILSVLVSRASADSPFRLQAGDYRPGFAFGGSYSPFRLGSWIALMPQVELSFVRRNATETGPADSSLAMDSIDLSVLARGELVAAGRTVYSIGGIYGSLLFDAQRTHEGRITDMGDTLSSVDAGWILGAGIELFSIAAVKPAVELRYQRGFRNLLPAGPGEVNQQSLSCLVSITSGGSSPAGSQRSVPGALHGSDDDRATQAPSTRRVNSVRTGYPGDRWLEDLQFTRIARATRDGVHGYEVGYHIAGHDEVVVLFWPRDRIDFDDRPRGSLLATRKLGTGRLRYPRRITRRSLPAVHAGILQIEAAYAKHADEEISVWRGFELIAALGTVRPIPHTTATTSTRAAASRGPNSAVRPSPTGAAAGARSQGASRELQAAYFCEPPGSYRRSSSTLRTSG